MNKILSKFSPLSLSGVSVPGTQGMTSTGHSVVAGPTKKSPEKHKSNAVPAPLITSHRVMKAPAGKAHLPNPIGHLKITRRVIENHCMPKNQKELAQYLRLIQYYVNFLMQIDHIICFGTEKQCAIQLAKKKLTQYKDEALRETICSLLESLEFIVDNETDERILIQVGSIKGCEALVAPFLKASVLDYTLHQSGNLFRLKHNILYPHPTKTPSEIEDMLCIIAVVDPEFSIAIRSLASS